VNYLGSVWSLRAFLPGLEAAGRSDVVNIVSVAGTVAFPPSWPLLGVQARAARLLSCHCGGVARARDPRTHRQPGPGGDGRISAGVGAAERAHSTTRRRSGARGTARRQSHQARQTGDIRAAVVSSRSGRPGAHTGPRRAPPLPEGPPQLLSGLAQEIPAALGHVGLGPARRSWRARSRASPRTRRDRGSSRGRAGASGSGCESGRDRWPRRAAGSRRPGGSACVMDRVHARNDRAPARRAGPRAQSGRRRRHARRAQ